MDDGAAGRGDQRDAAGDEWQSSLAAGGKGTFGVELALELLDRRAQLAGPVVIELADDQVDASVLGVIVDLAGHDQLLAVLGAERHPARRATAPDGVDGGRCVLERDPAGP